MVTHTFNLIWEVEGSLCEFKATISPRTARTMQRPCLKDRQMDRWEKGRMQRRKDFLLFSGFLVRGLQMLHVECTQ